MMDSAVIIITKLICDPTGSFMYLLSGACERAFPGLIYNTGQVLLMFSLSEKEGPNNPGHVAINPMKPRESERLCNEIPASALSIRKKRERYAIAIRNKGEN